MDRVRLGEVCKRVKHKVDKNKTDLKYYIGGEHFDNGEIMISRKGIIEGSTIGPAFHMCFQPGHVLLMSRNPHLRKAGVVNFEGICSDVSYVCETKDESILMQRFLPFVFQTDEFWAFAEANKKGSTNFFLNWSDFERYEFGMPDIETQSNLSDLLWAAYDTKESYKRLFNITDDLIKSHFIELFGNPLKNSKGWPTQKMKLVAPAIPYSGNVISEDGKCWLLNLDMIESNTGRIIEKTMVSLKDIGSSTTTFSPEHVLYSKLRPYLNKVAVPDNCGYATTELIPLKPNLNIISQIFLSWLLRGNDFVSFIENQVSGTKMPRVTMGVFWDFDVIIPPMEIQEQFEVFVQQSEKSKFELQQAIVSLENTIKSLLKQYIG